MGVRVVSLILLAGGVILGSQASLLAESFSLIPVADSFVVSSEPASNYGGAGVIGFFSPAYSMASFIPAAFRLVSCKVELRLGLRGRQLDTLLGNAPTGGRQSQQLNLQCLRRRPVSSNLAGKRCLDRRDGFADFAGCYRHYVQLAPSILSTNDQSLGTFNFDGSTTATAMYGARSERVG